MNFKQGFQQIYQAFFGKTVVKTERALGTSYGGIPPIVPFETTFANLCFAVINIRANGVAQVPNELNLINNKREKQIIPDNHWLKLLMESPNDYLNWIQTNIMLQMWKDYYGNSYLHTPVENGKYPQTAYVLPATKVKIVYGSREDLIKGYKLNVNGLDTFIDKKFICHFKSMRPDPNSLWKNNLLYGTPLLLNASTAAVSADKSLIEYVQRYFERDAVAPFIIKTKRKIPEAEWLNLKARITYWFKCCRFFIIS